jgi:dTDP-4-dehydrorhamnose 3,5-epimerase
MTNNETPQLKQLVSYRDNRGLFYESFKSSNDTLNTEGSNIHVNNYISEFNIIQENVCISNKNVIRGFHYQTGIYAQAKLLHVLHGEINDVLIDVRPGKDYGKVWKFNLKHTDRQLLFIPKGYAHGYSALKDNTIVSYKLDNYYNKNYEYGYHPLSPILNIDWGVELDKAIISEKDLNLLNFEFI